MKFISILVLAAAGATTAPAWALGQADLHHAIGDPARKDREVELVLDGVSDTATGELISPQEMAARLADTGLLFIGETHTLIEYHRVQLRTIQELHESGREVLIGLEMFPYTQQASLDKWIAGEQTEQEFVDEARWYEFWGYNWEYYREIFVYARDNGIPMYGVNTPRDVVAKIRREGFAALTAEEREHIPYEIVPATDEQRTMYRSFFDPADALHMSEDRLEGMLRAQTTWDATMGWNALNALQKHGSDDAIMVVLIGSGHVTYGLGSERQTDPYYDGNIASLIPVQIEDDTGAPVEKVQASYANFVWGLPKAEFEIFPSIGVSLMGPIGEKTGKPPTQIIQVSGDSIAARAGIVVGDVLLELNGEPVADAVQLRTIVSAWRWGDVATARIRRDGKELNVALPVRRKL